MYYALLAIAALLFSVQFFFTDKFREKNGSSLSVSLLLNAVSGVCSFLYMSALSGFKLEFSWFALLIAVFAATSSIVLSYCGIRALAIVNISQYSVYMMLGGMLLPFIFGLFIGERITVFKIICCLLIIAALFFNYEKGKTSFLGKIYFAVIFILNGLSGVFSTIHQKHPEHIASASYSALFFLSMAVLSLIAFFFTNKRPFEFLKRADKKSFLCPVGYSLCNGTAQLLLLICLSHGVEASVQYPIITGGTMVFATIISLIKKDNVSRKTIIAVSIAFLSSVFIVF